MTTPAGLVIRDETPDDADTITDLTEAAFRDSGLPGDRTEQRVILALREAGALTISLVAEVEDWVVGHIAFSPATLSGGTTGWYVLGPVSVLPAWQGEGIGSALIEEGLDRLCALGAGGCVLAGPGDYYRRFGFDHAAGLEYPGVPAEFVFALSLDGTRPIGRVRHHPAFG